MNDDPYRPKTPRGGRSDRQHKKGGFKEKPGGYQKGGGHKGGGGDFSPSEVPDNLVIKESFYDNGNLKRAVFLGEAEEAADFFSKNEITQTSFRNLFYMLKSMSNRVKREKKLDIGAVRQRFYEFARQVDYQVKRKVIKCPAFADFVRKHEEVATKNKEEFLGFVEYLTSIVARLKQK